MKLLNRSSNILISLYLCVMLGFFPLYYRYQYANMGDEKYKIFLYASSVCVVVFFLLWMVRHILKYRDRKKGRKNKNYRGAGTGDQRQRTILDTAVLIYFICVTVSYLFSPFKEAGFWGAEGWKMGFLSQFLFIAIYFIIAKAWPYQKWALVLLGVSSAVVFIIAVFHRFDVDLLPIYGNLKEAYKVQFLSTMGQSSWYSSFLCTVFPVGLYLFFSQENKKWRIVAGVYSVIAMLTLVTQNTDSAFLSLFAVLVMLFYLSFENKGKRFLEVIILVLASFCFMGICQRILADRMIPLDSLSLFMSQNGLMWIALVAVVFCYIVIFKRDLFVKSKNGMNPKSESTVKVNNRTLFWVLLGTILVSVLMMCVFIILNTNGFLLEKFGYQNTGSYLLFDEHWGNERGFAWMFTMNTFAEMPFLRKLFGVGPDCFSAYVASVPQYLEQMKGFWGNLVLTNAHNEYLTKLYNIGIIGLISYVGMLVSAVVTFMKKRHENPLLPAFALCIVSYMTHNIFCYEQVCCTPILYILMGIGSNLIHNQGKKSTY